MCAASSDQALRYDAAMSISPRSKTASRRTGASAASAPATHIALLRGINVGGKNKLPMRELAALFLEAGGNDVRTYIQSGNVLFNATAHGAGQIAKRVQELITDRFGYEVPVVVRTIDELTMAAQANPFLKAGKDVQFLHVAFLANAPSREHVARLDPARSVGDEIAVHGRELYLYLPNGVARTKFTNSYLDRTLATVSTLRNWRTVQKLIELAAPPRAGG